MNEAFHHPTPDEMQRYLQQARQARNAAIADMARWLWARITHHVTGEADKPTTPAAPARYA